MNAIQLVIIFLIVSVLPVAWFVSEFRAQSRRVRCILGILSILSCFGVAWLTAQLTRLNYNAWYGFSSKGLIDVIVEKLEEGQTEILKSELRSLQSEFRPTYEGKAHYNELMDAAVRNIKAAKTANNFQDNDAIAPEPQK